MSDREATTENESPLSLRRLTNAFASMMGRKTPPSGDTPTGEVAISTRTIVEALLFVGRPDNQPLSAEALAGMMRDITPEEVSAAARELNAEYDADGAAMTIVQSAAGYRMVLREELGRVREKFHGKVQQATLTPAAMEVLAIIAYRQPVDLKTIDDERGQKSQSLASSLVRRGLVRLVRPEGNPKQAQYHTTERFLQVFGLRGIDQLPQAAEFEAA